MQTRTARINTRVVASTYPAIVTGYDNLDLKLQDSAFLDDIERLLATRLKNNHSRPLGFATESGQGIKTEGWSLLDAIETIKSTLLDQLD